ncbi:MAG: hypothetical protein RRA92_06045 [Gemmatimonadota bacterium]|nr:hypothetical protein [Gemmatimonadota bacterium]
MRRSTSLAMFVAMLLAGAGTLGAQEAQEAAKPTVPSHDMAGKENCVMCHKVEGGMAALPAAHEGLAVETCTLCHAETSPMQSGNAPPAIPHDLAGKENCAMCHKAGVMGAAKIPENHGEVANELCGTCHKPSA